MKDQIALAKRYGIQGPTQGMNVREIEQYQQKRVSRYDSYGSPFLS
jgi:hypothetical protein